MSNEKQQQGIWDPSEVGPFDRCIKCFTLYNDNFAFCSFCGHVSTVFDTPRETSGVKCHIHSSIQVIGCCCLCAEPICEDCKEKEHYSIAGGFHNLYYCRNCVKKAEDIKKEFSRKTKEQKLCAKHHDRKASFDCIECGLALCNECSYFTNKGWFRKKLGEGSYCLSCFRKTTIKGGRSNWISGKEATEKGLVK